MKVKTKNTNKILRNFIIILLSGTVCLAIGLTFLFVMYRPFVPWMEKRFEEDLWKEGEVGTFYMDEVSGDLTKSILHYFFEIDGVKYEETYPASISSHGDFLRQSYSVIYVNADNPHETKPGSQGGGMLLSWIIIFSSLGGLVMFIAFFQYYRANKVKAKNKIR